MKLAKIFVFYFLVTFSGTADDEEVSLSRTIMVPKIFEARKELGLSRIEPRHLVEEDDQALLFGKRIEVLPQKHEGFAPGIWGRAKGWIPKAELIEEIVKLILKGCAFGAGHFENQVIFERLVHKERLSDAAAAHDNRKLRMRLPVAFFQGSIFGGPSDQIVFLHKKAISIGIAKVNL